MMKTTNRRQRGFTLIEIAIVLMVVAILLGYGVAMFPVQQELKQYRAAESEMDEVIEHLIAFAQINGRLPCPDTAAAALDGLEDRVGLNRCTAYFGFIPGRTLGMEGNYNANNQLVDPWGAGYGYAVSDFTVGAGADRVLVTANGMRNAGINNVVPDLYLCSDSTAAINNTDCSLTGGVEVLGSNGEVSAVIISLGRDRELPATSDIQAENADNFNDGTLDKVYIYSGRRDDYDDIVKWIPTNLLISRLIAAEQLP